METETETGKTKRTKNPEGFYDSPEQIQRCLHCTATRAQCDNSCSGSRDRTIRRSRRYSAETRARAEEMLRAGATMAAVAAELDVNPNTVAGWRRAMRRAQT